MTIPEPILTAWAGLSTRARLILVAWVAFALFVLCTMLASGVSHFKDSRFDARETKREAERTALVADRDAAITRAEAAEAKAAVLQEAVDAQKRIAEDKAATAREQAARAKETEDATNRLVDATRGMSADDAREYTRAELRRLGLLR